MKAFYDDVCSECGFDHSFAPQSAAKEHERLLQAALDDEDAAAEILSKGLTPSDVSLSAQANCGCVFHAEDGVPCPHDLVRAFDMGLIDADDFLQRMERLHPKWVERN